MEFQPSKYQQEIFDHVTLLVQGKQAEQHALVEAVAGSGKTKTIEMATNLIPRDITVCFVAFNKAIAEELKRRAPPHVRAMTLHSLGFQAVNHAMSANGKRANVNTRKVGDTLKMLFQTQFMQLSQEEVNNMLPVAIKLVSLLKATLMEATKENIEYLIERYGIENDSDTDILTKVCAATMVKCKHVFDKFDSSDIDFDDQIWLPVVHNLPMFQYDFVFIDETQDLNKAQLELALKAVKPNGHIIAVGDRNQSIYGFRGADVEAIPRIIERLKAKTFPLSITYRCPKSHVALAKQFVPEIEAAEWAEEGQVIGLQMNKLQDNIKPGDLAICRYNAPLVKPCFQLIRAGIKATIRGRDIGEGLITLIRKFRAKTMKEFYVKADKWMQREEERARMKGASAESSKDKYETLMALAEDCDVPDCLTRKIQTIFSDEGSTVVFSSIHKAKGLEADNVFVIKPSLMPSKYATRDWELIQEKNLQYVAFTRAKKNLYMVE